MKAVVLTFNGHRLTAPTSGKFIFRHGTASIAGTAYKTVQIGSQEWLAENLQLDDGGTGIYTGQSAPYAGEHFYTWDAMERISNLLGDGWHVPSKTEFETMISAVGGASSAAKLLKSTYGWFEGNGTDNHGFNAIPAGWWESGAFRGASLSAWFYSTTSDESDIDYAYVLFLRSWDDTIMYLDEKSVTAHSIRLVRSV